MILLARGWVPRVAAVAVIGLSSSTRADSVDELVQKTMEEERIPGVSIVVIKNGKIVKEKGYGLADVENAVPVTKNTVHKIASVTKVLSGTAMMMLVEEKLLSLEHALGDLLPNVPQDWRNVTVHQLLSHMSGLPDLDQSDMSLSTRAEVLASVRERPMQSAPGTKWSYNQVGYVIAGMLIKKKTGLDWEAFANKRFFDPLGMKSARFGGGEVAVPNRAKFYDVDEKGDFVAAEAMRYPRFHWNGAGLNISAIDLAKWDIALRDHRFLKQETMDVMWSPVKLSTGEEVRFRGGNVGYACGWGVYHYPNGQVSVGHEGGGNAVYYRYLLADVAVIVLMNRDISGSALSRLAGMIAVQFM